MPHGAAIRVCLDVRGHLTRDFNAAVTGRARRDSCLCLLLHVAIVYPGERV